MIAGIAWAPYRIPFVTPYETAHGAATHRSGILLRLETNDGFRGIGEANLDPSRPEAHVESLFPAVEGLTRALLGATPDEYDDVLDMHATGDEAARAAHCAVEAALADAGGRAAGVSVAALLANQFMSEEAVPWERVRVNATIAQRHTDAAAKAALLAVAAGYSCVKLKVGMERTLAAEVERVRTVREIIGPDVKLRLDANGAWQEDAAIAAIRALEAFEIESIEQPVPPGDFDALNRVRSAVTAAVAADEAVVDYDTAQRAIASADAVVLKPMRLGGASTTRYLAQYAAASGLGVVVTTTIDTGIATALALHVAASLPDAASAHGLATASLLQHDLLSVPLGAERGMIHLPVSPGLGVELDEQAAARYLQPWREVR